ncbi:hypothetical protein EMN47_12285 [Prolixibacteraceae bacterium JC049]|nr:hypothetical protein [Prolixibacteraceae bacterium JC049]
MTEPIHNINILTFSHPEKVKTFGFKLNRQNGLTPLRKGEFPRELWEKHQAQLDGVDYLYCDFTTTENCDFVVQVDLSYSIYFAKHYYHHQIAQYFKTVAQVVHPNFVNSATIWFESPKESTADYKLYYKFTLSVRLAIMTNQPELIVSFDGTSKVLRKNILELVSDDIPTEKLNWLVRNGELISYNNLSDQDNNHLDEFYPVLNHILADELRISPSQFKPNNDKYAKYFTNINGLLSKYLNTEEFKKVIPHSSRWIELESVALTSKGTNVLRFGNGTHTDPYEGLKQFKPCYPAPRGHYRFFFICHESDKETARNFHRYSKKEKGFIKFSDFLSLPITYDNDLHIHFSNLENPMPEIEGKLSTANLIPNTNYLAIYISPYSKDDPDHVKRNYYYKIKQLLLKYSISSQVIYNKNINKDNFKYHVSNIAVAILAKLNGVPWRLDREINNELIIGIGAYKTKQYNLRYLGSTFCFDNTGRFKEFNVLPADNHILLAGAIREAVEEYKRKHQNTERIIIHFYKRMNKKEEAQIIRQLKAIDTDVPIVIVTVNKSKSNDIVFFDQAYDHKMPYSGSYISIGRDSYILCNNTRYKPTLNDEHSEQERQQERQQLEKQLKSYPLPIKIHLQSTDPSIIQNHDEVKQIIDQVYQFSRMYWKSISPQALPVTVLYPALVAEIYPHFEGGILYDFGKKNPWFL